MRILVTSSRMPFALDEIRKLGKEGHQVIASDTFRNAPGSHSRFAESWKITASPRFATKQFIADIQEIVKTEKIDLIVPAFEEVFYLAWYRDQLKDVELFFPSYETLMLLHDKAATIELARKLDVRAPRTVLVEDQNELMEAIEEIGSYFARPAYSRGGVHLLTNTGPLVGALSPKECQPTSSNPWLVQEYVEGEDICTFSVVHHGRITAHSTYVHPRELEHAGGIVFESIVEDEGLDISRRIAEASHYHGQLSLDFRRTPEGLVLIECNPRPTAGVYVMSPGKFVEALLEPRPDMVPVAPAGVRYKYSVALIRDMVLHWKEIPDDLEHLLSSAKDLYAERGDLIPALYQFLSYSQVTAYRKHMHGERDSRTDLMAAYFYDISYDGEPLERLAA